MKIEKKNTTNFYIFHLRRYFEKLLTSLFELDYIVCNKI